MSQLPVFLTLFFVPSLIRAIDTPHEGISLVTATQAKRMGFAVVVSSGSFVEEGMKEDVGEGKRGWHGGLVVQE